VRSNSSDGPIAHCACRDDVSRRYPLQRRDQDRGDGGERGGNRPHRSSMRLTLML
jgi:hypothetical protein